MVQMLLAEGMLLCSLFWAFCWLGTGSDEKNIRNFLLTRTRYRRL